MKATLRCILFAAVLGLAACAGPPASTATTTGVLATPVTVGQSPEQQIDAGSNTVTSTTTLVTVALRNHAISVSQAASLRNMLVASGQALKDANVELVQCRKDTGSSSQTAPDPCWPKVGSVVTIALQNIAGVASAVAAK